MRVAVVAVWLNVVLLVGSGVADALDTERIVGENEGAVVVIYGNSNASGSPVQSSGCCIDASGLLVSTAHQVRGMSGLHARLADGSEYPVEVLATDITQDFALLKVNAPSIGVARLGDASLLQSGSPLLSIASPKGLDFTTVTGIVSNTHRLNNGVPVVQTDLPASPGSSGGPVFDKDGRLVGIIIGKAEDVDRVTLFNPINNAYPILKRFGVAVPGEDREWASSDEIIPAEGINQRELAAVEKYNAGVRASSVHEKIEAYTQTVKLVPEFYEAWFNLGVALTDAKKFEEALAAYREAARLRPKATEAYGNLGRLYLRLEDYPNAVDAFRHTVALQPQSASAHNDLGEALRRSKDFDAALPIFETAIKLDPQYASAEFNLGLTYVELNQNSAAIDHLNNYLRLAPDARDADEVKTWIRQLGGN